MALSRSARARVAAILGRSPNSGGLVRCFVSYNDNGDKIVDGLPPKQGLYDPSYERGACGTGFVVDIKGASP